MTRQTLHLTGCGKSKRSEASPARELYTSALCKLRAEYVQTRIDFEKQTIRENLEAGGDDDYVAQIAQPQHWRIISAEYGLVDPDATIEPYDTAITDLTAGQISDWADGIVAGCLELVEAAGARPRDFSIQLHAGVDYRKPLVAKLEAAGFRYVGEPQAGHGIGQQLASYRNMIDVTRQSMEYAAEDHAEAMEYEARTAKPDGLPRQQGLFNWAAEYAAA